MLFEIQQKSDLTYRVYDYDRRDAQGNLRELHLDRALDVIDYGAPPPAQVVPQALGDGRTLLVTCRYFAMERWEISGSVARETQPSSFVILTAIDGAAELGWDDGALELRRGVSVVLPASLGGYQLRSQPQATLLACYVP
jgi:mannose-6-phosphate isomerase